MNPLAEAPPLYAAYSPQRCVEKELRVGKLFHILKDVGVGLTLSEPVCSLSSGREMLASETALPTEPHSLWNRRLRKRLLLRTASTHLSLKTGKGSVMDPATLAVGMSDFALPCYVGFFF